MADLDGSGTVLIIDDEPMNIILLEAILRREGFATLRAADGPEGRAVAERERPALILLDVMMPGENGLETCRRLKENPKTAAVPVIFVSALDEAERTADGFSSGAAGFITKPFNAAEVLARVRRHLSPLPPGNPEPGKR